MLSKKVLSTVLAASLTLSCVAFAADTATTTTTPAATTTTTTTAAAATTAANKSGFDDVKDDAPYANAVVRLNKLGVIAGTADKTFAPDDKMTRAQAAKVLVKSLGIDNVKGQKSVLKFADLDASAWYAKESLVDKAAAAGLIKGYTKDGKNYFNPDGKVTYGQFITMVVRALGYTEDDLVGDTWPFNYVAKATELHVLDNVGDIDVDAEVKRSDLAIIADAMMFSDVKQTWNARQTGVAGTRLIDMVYKRLGLDRVTLNDKDDDGNYKSIVLATSANDADVKEGKILVGVPGGTLGKNVKEYDVASSNVKEFMGKRITIYYPVASPSTIVYADYDTATGNVQTGNLKKSSVAGYNGYTVDGVGLKGAAKVVYFNGVKKDPSIFTVPDDSKATFVNGVLYAAKEDQKSIRVYSVDVANKKIVALKDNGGVGQTITYIDKAVLSGDVTKFEDLKKYDVVYFTTDLEDGSVLNDTPKVEKIKVVRKTAADTINGKAQDNAWVTLTTGSTKIDVDDAGKSTVGAILFGRSYTFVLNKDNKVVYCYETSPNASTVQNSNVDTTLMVFKNYISSAAGGYDAYFVNQKGEEKVFHFTGANVKTTLDNILAGAVGRFVKVTADASNILQTVADKDGNGVAYTGGTLADFSLIADSAQVVINSNGVISKITGAEFKAKYVTSDATNKAANIMQKVTLGTQDPISGISSVVFAYFVNPVAKSLPVDFYVITDKNSGIKVNDTSYMVKAYVNGVLKDVKLSDTMFNGLDSNGFTVANAVYYDPTDSTRVTGFDTKGNIWGMNGKLGTVITGVDVARNIVQTGVQQADGSIANPKTYTLSSSTQLYKLGSDSKPAPITASGLQPGMRIEAFDESGTLQAAVVANVVTFRFSLIVSPNSLTTADDDIYCVGTFNDWPGNDWSKLPKMNKTVSADGTVTFTSSDLTWVVGTAYKFVRSNGSGNNGGTVNIWNSVEKDSNGKEMSNRILPEVNGTYSVSIAKWADR